MSGIQVGRQCGLGPCICTAGCSAEGGSSYAGCSTLISLCVFALLLPTVGFVWLMLFTEKASRLSMPCSSCLSWCFVVVCSYVYVYTALVPNQLQGMSWKLGILQPMPPSSSLESSCCFLGRHETACSCRRLTLSTRYVDGSQLSCCAGHW